MEESGLPKGAQSVNWSSRQNINHSQARPLIVQFAQVLEESAHHRQRDKSIFVWFWPKPKTSKNLTVFMVLPFWKPFAEFLKVPCGLGKEFYLGFLNWHYLELLFFWQPSTSAWASEILFGTDDCFRLRHMYQNSVFLFCPEVSYSYWRLYDNWMYHWKRLGR